ncbi:MAG: hypothetical protein WDA22_16300 [Bacteroidota bacterium]
MEYIGVFIAFISTLLLILRKDPYEELTIFKKKYILANIVKLFLCIGLIISFITIYDSDKKSDDQYNLTSEINTRTTIILKNFDNGLDSILKDYKTKSDIIVDSLRLKTNDILRSVNPILIEIQNQQEFVSRDIEKRFTTYVILTDRRLPPFFNYSKTNNNWRKFNIYHSLSTPRLQFNGKDTILFSEPEYYDSTSSFYCEMLQYAIFKEMVEINTLIQPLTPGNPFPVTNNPYNLSQSEKIPLINLLQSIATNRFSRNPSESIYYEGMSFRLPKKTNVYFKSNKLMQSEKSDEYKIVLQKPKYFTVEVIIIPKSNTGTFRTSLFIKKLDISLTNTQDVSALSTYSYEIVLKAHFDRNNLGSYQTKESIKWIDDMFDKLIAKFNDDTM